MKKIIFLLIALVTQLFVNAQGINITHTDTILYNYNISALDVNSKVDMCVTNEKENIHYRGNLLLGNSIRSYSSNISYATVPTYTVTISSTGNGKVEYAGTVIRSGTKVFSVEEGGDVTIVSTPDEGYRVKSVYGKNDGYLGTTWNYTDKTSVPHTNYLNSNVKTNVNVEVVFEKIPDVFPTYTVTISSTGNGKVEYAGDVVRSGTKVFSVEEGGDVTIVSTPDEGYRVKSVYGKNDGYLGTTWNYTDKTSIPHTNYLNSNVKTNVNVEVVFEKIPDVFPTYTVTISSTGNGKVEYAGDVVRSGTKVFSVEEGGDVTIVSTPDEGYRVKSVYGKNDGYLGTTWNYTDKTSIPHTNYLNSNVKTNVNVEVVFERIPGVDIPENIVYLEDVTTAQNTTKAISVKLKNDSEITNFQFDVYLPAGVTIATSSADFVYAKGSRAATSHSLTCAQQSDGAYRFFCYSASNAIFTGNNGEIMNFTVQVPADTPKGEYTITIKNAKVSETNGTKYTTDNTSAKLSVTQGDNGEVTYTLTYKVDGEVYKEYNIEKGTAITPEEAPTKTGYTFSGWSEIPSVMPDYNVVVTGSFIINQYTITFDTNGGSAISPIIQDYGSAITAPANPTKTGYTFAGWDKEIPATMPAENVTVKALWTINKYKLTYMVDGEVYNESEVEYNAAVTPLAVPTKDGYTFSGWSEIPERMPDHDVTITGTFSANTHILTYKVDGEVYKTITYVTGATITPEPAPTKTGYTFSGWNDLPTIMPDHDVVVTGSFTVNQYTITFDTDGGSAISPITQAYGSAVTAPGNPTKTGYTFAGWDKEIPTTMPAENVTIKALWTVNSYKLTYMVDDQLYVETTVRFGDPITPEPALTKEGYTFSGWSAIPTTMPARDVVITGCFTVNKYKVTFIVDGTVVKEDNLDYGSAITVPNDPVKEGYTFIGWIPNVDSTVPAHDVTYTAQFEVASGVAEIEHDSAPVKIYTLGGAMQKSNATSSDYKSLKKGIYIINGKKVVAK